MSLPAPSRKTAAIFGPKPCHEQWAHSNRPLDAASHLRGYARKELAQAPREALKSTEQTFVQAAAKVQFEPIVTDAEKCANDSLPKRSGRSFLNCNASLQPFCDLGRPITSPEFSQAAQLM
jgi:hypothetical protein